MAETNLCIFQWVLILNCFRNRNAVNANNCYNYNYQTSLLAFEMQDSDCVFLQFRYSSAYELYASKISKYYSVHFSQRNTG